jgi:hypothetical protein
MEIFNFTLYILISLLFFAQFTFKKDEINVRVLLAEGEYMLTVLGHRISIMCTYSITQSYIIAKFNGPLALSDLHICKN